MQLQGPEQRAVLDRLLALTTLLEGHADHVMDAAGPEVVPSVETIRARFTLRRRGGGVGAAALWVRRRGWAQSVAERETGVASVSAPVRDGSGAVLGAVSISGPVERLCDSHYRPHTRLVGFVRDAARAISRDLGATR